MITLAELERRLNNLCQIGTMSEVYEKQCSNEHDDYALFAKVDIMGRVTDFFPVMAQQGSFKKHYCPPQIGEQVMVFCPFGNANVGYIMRGVFHSDGEPIEHSEKDRQTEYIEYADGTKIEISLHDKKIKLNTPMDVEIGTSGNMSVTSSKPFVLNAPNVQIDKDGNLTVKGQVIDKIGNLTFHPHDVLGYLAKPRS